MKLTKFSLAFTLVNAAMMGGIWCIDQIITSPIGKFGFGIVLGATACIGGFEIYSRIFK